MNKKRTIKYVILVIAILIVLIILLTSLGDIKKIVNIFKTSVKWYYLLACLGAVLIYFFFVESSLYVLVKKKYKDKLKTEGYKKETAQKISGDKNLNSVAMQK